MDILTFTALQKATAGAPLNKFFTREPKFCFFSANSATNGVVSYYGDRETVPMTTFSRGNAQGMSAEQPPLNNLWGNTETYNNESGSWYGNASSEGTSNSYSPSSGYVGIAQHSQLFCAAADFSSETDLSLNTSSVLSTMDMEGVIVGENAAYRQGLFLGKDGQYLRVNYADIRVNHQNFFGNRVDWTTLVGLQRLSGSPANAGLGDVAYNRTTKTLAFIEGYGGTSYMYRMHVFKNLKRQITANGSDLKALLEGAIAGQDGASYETIDFTWTGFNNTEWHTRTRIIPCDDGTFWLSRMYPSSSLRLARITGGTGTRVFDASVQTIALTTSYGNSSGTGYGIRHMNSDNQKFVAVYCVYSAYISGACLFLLPRDSAADKTRIGLLQNADTSRGCSLAPMGGSMFVLGRGTNMDNKSVDGLIFDGDAVPLNNTDLMANFASSFTGVSVIGVGASTMYGGNGFIKIKPTRNMMTEWNERTN